MAIIILGYSRAQQGFSLNGRWLSWIDLSLILLWFEQSSKKIDGRWLSCSTSFLTEKLNTSFRARDSLLSPWLILKVNFSFRLLIIKIKQLLLLGKATGKSALPRMLNASIFLRDWMATTFSILWYHFAVRFACSIWLLKVYFNFGWLFAYIDKTKCVR